jgi:outer membrane lipoprotein-sorting protein
MQKFFWLILLFSFLVFSDAWAQEKFDPEKWIKDAETVLIGTDSYTAVFHKQERIKGELAKKETIFIKFKKPLKIYMKWIEHPFKGRETLYVEGRNDNKLNVHEGGFLSFITFNLDPKSTWAMKGNRHPITNSGLDYLVKMIEENVRKGIKSGEMTWVGHGIENVYGRNTHKIELIFPKDDLEGFYCYRAVVYTDLEQKVPIKIRIFDWGNRLIEDYAYEDLKLDAGLKDHDFDSNNPEYNFR